MFIVSRGWNNIPKAVMTNTHMSNGSEGNTAWIETGNRKHRCPTRAAALIEGTHVPNIKIQGPVISND